MRPVLHPSLVNGRFGDPALYVEALHQRAALLFDLGDLSALSARDLLRTSHAFVTHTHMDHFVGFDALLRIHVGRDKTLALVGPEGFAERVGHKLQAYEWDLVDRYEADLTFEVTEVRRGRPALRARFRFKAAFEREELGEAKLADGIVAATPWFEVRAAVLDHHGPCLGYAVAERAHVNVWKNRLDARGLATGPWLQALKRAVTAGAGDEEPIPLPDGGTAKLGTLRDLVSVSQGQKIAYVTDVADTPANRAAIAALAEGADSFFLEARFAAADAEQARARAHLTSQAAGEIARAAGARRFEPFHFSPRYEADEERMLAEAMAPSPPGAERNGSDGGSF
ncbi:MAG: MBL fold metallo-hydrolase [Pseudomonadota bacterium]|nr:MBL fold metallo-hydrolase [Pseudomonadota bacterium]